MESKKMVQMNLLYGRNRVIDVENGHVDMWREGEGRTNWEYRFYINTIPCVE